MPGGQGEQDAAEEGEICPVALLSALCRDECRFGKLCIKCCHTYLPGRPCTVLQKTPRKNLHIKLNAVVCEKRFKSLTISE